MVIRVEKDRTQGASKSSRYRVTVRAAAHTPPVYVSIREYGSVIHAKNEAELVFGKLEWDAQNEARPARIVDAW